MKNIKQFISEAKSSVIHIASWGGEHQTKATHSVITPEALKQIHSDVHASLKDQNSAQKASKVDGYWAKHYSAVDFSYASTPRHLSSVLAGKHVVVGGEHEQHATGSSKEDALNRLRSHIIK